MRRPFVLLLVLSLGACTTVKVVQRDQCWVRQTKRFLGSFKEDLGPCSRAEPKWAEDRVTRIVQECVAQADYRWQGQALAAWNRGESLPPRPSEDSVLRDCMQQASGSKLAENERLQERVSELAGEKAALASQAEKDHERVWDGYDKVAGDLGEAAKRAPAPAVATATASSEGHSSSEGRSQNDTGLSERTIVREHKSRLVSPLPAGPPAHQPRSASNAGEADRSSQDRPADDATPADGGVEQAATTAAASVPASRPETSSPEPNAACAPCARQ